jgi:hypothetical protein
MNENKDYQSHPWMKAFAEIGQITLQVKKIFDAEIAPRIGLFVDGMNRFPTDIAPTVRELMHRGWFISAEMGVSGRWCTSNSKSG